MYSEKILLHEKQRNFIKGNLRTIALDVTPKCNMKCPHCYAETFAKTKPIDLSILEKAFNEAYEMGVFHYVLQGGEPITDSERLEAIIKMIHPDETYINVVSNGWGMTKEKIKWLKSLKVDKIAFSLDSGVEQEHDEGRLQGSYKKVLEAIDEVINEGLLTSISTVVTHKSLYSDGFKIVYEYAKNKDIKVDVQIAMPVGKWDGKKELLINQEDALYIKKLQLDSPILSNGQKMISRDIFSGERDHCPAGKEFMAITADGNFLPCNFIQCTLGNIKEKSLKQMRDDLLKSHWFGEEHAVCICGEDRNYIDNNIIPYINEKKPLDAYKVFKL